MLTRYIKATVAVLVHIDQRPHVLMAAHLVMCYVPYYEGLSIICNTTAMGKLLQF